MRMAELAEAHLPAMDADADAELVAARSEVALHLAGGQHGLAGMVGLADRKVEDRHHGIADGLVEKPVVTPDGVGAAVIELVEEARHLGRRLRLRQLRVGAQVGEQDGGVDRHRARLHGALEHQLADRAQVGVHAARPDADGAERHGQHATQRYRHVLLLPAALADRGVGQCHGASQHTRCRDCGNLLLVGGGGAADVGKQQVPGFCSRSSGRGDRLSRRRPSQPDVRAGTSAAGRAPAAQSCARGTRPCRASCSVNGTGNRYCRRRGGDQAGLHRLRVGPVPDAGRCPEPRRRLLQGAAEPPAQARRDRLGAADARHRPHGARATRRWPARTTSTRCSATTG